MKHLSLCIAAGALGTAAAAFAQAPTVATPPNTTVTAPKSQKAKRVCRERMRSGSHLTNVVCKTPEQWAELQEQYDSEAEYGIPGNKTATGRAMDRGIHGGSPGHRPGP
jgi:hypothetical protein